MEGMLQRGGSRAGGWLRGRSRAGHDLHFLTAFQKKFAQPLFFIGLLRYPVI